MRRVYRVLAIALTLIGLLVIWQVIRVTIGDMMHDAHPYAIKCDARGCRSILPDGSLADDQVSRPGRTR